MAVQQTVQYRTFHEVLTERARSAPDRAAFVYLEDGEGDGQPITYAELRRRALAVAGALRACADPQARVLLLLPPGIEYVTALFGCFYSRTIGLSAAPPLPKKLERTWPRLLAMGADASVDVVVTTPEFRATAERLLDGKHRLTRARWLVFDEIVAGPDAAGATEAPSPDDLAYLQYTSGSTGDARGVALSHRTLLVNCELFGRSWGHSSESRLYTWLPPYHDLGLIGDLLQSVYLGSVCYIASPLSFIKRPRRWLEGITRFGITSSRAPNFAFDLCVDRIPPAERAGLDLSSWTCAANAAEPVRPSTIERFTEAYAPFGFAPEALTPAWGLAEATLIVTSGDLARPPLLAPFETGALRRGSVVAADPGDARPATVMVGCGGPLDDHELAIVDPVTRTRRPPGELGEVWVAGPSVVEGYWDRPRATRETFQARLADEPDAGPFMRTGDLGFVHDGELFIAGRIKDVLIVHGANYHPHDIEAVAEGCDGRVRAHSSAAFQTEDPEAPGLVIAFEAERDDHEPAELEAMAAAVLRAIAEATELQFDRAVVVPRGTVPKTTSGKIQRRLCRTRLEDGAIQPLYERRRSSRG